MYLLEQNITVEQKITNGRHSLRNRIKKIAERWVRNYTTRRKLAQLDDNILRDVGIDSITAAQEASKPFWQN